MTFKTPQNDKQRFFFRKIARKKGMSNTILFEEFMLKRLPNESSPCYVAEWVERFQSGNPIGYMDSKSKKAYVEAVKEV